MKTVTTISKSDIVALACKALKADASTIAWQGEFKDLLDDSVVATIEGAPRLRKIRAPKQGTGTAGTKYSRGRKARGDAPAAPAEASN